MTRELDTEHTFMEYLHHACPRTLRLMMAASLTVRMQVRGKAPPVVFRRGFGVRGGGLVVSLP
jgi:hypothetical protein